MQPGENVSIALVHHPVYNRNRELVTSAVTNLDLHDIARAARTFGLDRYYVVTPATEQQDLARRIGRHWQDGWGAGYNPKRKSALELMTVVATLDDACDDLARMHGTRPLTVVTGAAERGNGITCRELRERIAERDRHWLLVFGTGWGLAEVLFDRADLVLEPIRGAGSYNHLSVRSAASIIMDRLLGR
jgi:hypothetical protein